MSRTIIGLLCFSFTLECLQAVPRPSTYAGHTPPDAFEKQRSAPHRFHLHSLYYQDKGPMHPAFQSTKPKGVGFQSIFQRDPSSTPMLPVDPECVDRSRPDDRRGMYYRCGYQALPYHAQENYQWAQPIRRQFSPPSRQERPFFRDSINHSRPPGLRQSGFVEK